MIAEHERAELLAELRRNRDLLLAAAAGLTPAQAAFRPAPNPWSVLELLEHVAIAEKLMFRAATKGAREGAPPNDPQLVDRRLREAMADRATRRAAPDIAQPKSRYASVADALADFEAARDKVMAYVETTTDPLRERTVLHPVAREIDGFQALLLLALHAGRHARQLEEWRALPDFPAASS